ncbi:MAG: MBL fold metallo-hydrolase [Candidatus Cyclobacteriaceae bacterium M2_1C_046]
MNLHVINTGYFKLDGGAMFGVVPKSLWNKLNPADENNMCSWALRCLLIEDGDRLILIDNGMGDKQSAKFFSFYYLHGDDSLDKSLKAAGFSKDDITDVILTHLHFDHCGGSVIFNLEGKAELNFKNARYWSNEDHWKWATNPNPREKASFLKENISPIQEQGHLNFIDPVEGSPFKNIQFFFADGHTEKQMIPIINYKNKKIAFMADLLPSTHHIPLPYIMSYDVRPLVSMHEKEKFLHEALANNYTLFLEHDPDHECCTLQETEKGIRLKDTFNLREVL